VDFGPPVGGLHAERAIAIEFQLVRSGPSLGQLCNRQREHRLDESDSAFLDLQGDDVTAQKGGAQESLRFIPLPWLSISAFGTATIRRASSRHRNSAAGRILKRVNLLICL
jgi:hypothetical protein